MNTETFSPPLDPGIAKIVEILRAAGVETFESCEGGSGHSFLEPTVRFHGNSGAGHHALGIAMTYVLPVSQLRRTWDVVEGCPTGPYWELVFRKKFQLAPRYFRDGDCVILRFSNERSHSDRVDGYLTIYYSDKTDEIVGYRIGGITRLLETHPGGNVKLDWLLKACPGQRPIHKELAEQSKSIVIDRAEIEQ